MTKMAVNNWWIFVKKEKEALISPSDINSVIDSEGKKDNKLTIERYNQIKDYSFKVSRVKHSITGEENLHVIAYSNNEQYGYIITKVSELDARIKKLSDYGIVMHQLVWDSFCKAVRDNYNQIDIERREFIDIPILDKLVEAFVILCGQHINEENINICECKKEKFYDIKVESFTKIYEESSFDYYSINTWRKALKMQGYTKCNSNRTDYTTDTVDESGKKQKIKVIRFYAEKIEALMENN